MPKIVIGLDDDIYRIVKNELVIICGMQSYKTALNKILDAIVNGTVLPKGYEPYFLKEVKISIRGKATHMLYDYQRHCLLGKCLSAENAKLLGVEILTDENELPNVLYEVEKESEKWQNP